MTAKAVTPFSHFLEQSSSPVPMFHICKRKKSNNFRMVAYKTSIFSLKLNGILFLLDFVESLILSLRSPTKNNYRLIMSLLIWLFSTTFFPDCSESSYNQKKYHLFFEISKTNYLLCHQW